MSNFLLDIRWWIFATIIVIGQICDRTDCVKQHKKTNGLLVNENNESDAEYNDRSTTDCPQKCLCLGDLNDCSKNDLEEIPKIPSWAKKL